MKENVSVVNKNKEMTSTKNEGYLSFFFSIYFIRGDLGGPLIEITKAHHDH